MSRLLALVAVAVIAFLCAPRPVKVTYDKPHVEEAVEELIIPEGELETEAPDAFYREKDALASIHDFVPALDLLDRALVEAAITADPLGPPLAPEVRDYREPPRQMWPGRGPRMLPHWLGERLCENGANSDSQRAMALGLAWLAKQQQKDGNWEYDGSEKPDRITATGLVLLTYIAVDQVRRSPDGDDSKYFRTANGGLYFLLKQCPLGGPRAGRFENTSVTGQAVATLALCEAYAATRDPGLKPYAQAALNYLQKAQDRDGGWRDTPDAVSDIATLGWVVQALDSARRAGDLAVDDRALKRASRFLDTLAAGPQKSMFGSTHRSEAKPGTAATAIGLFCRDRLDGWTPETPAMIDGVARLMQNPPSATNRDPLYLYYATFVVWRSGGEDWTLWNGGPTLDEFRVRRGGVRDVLAISQNRKDGAAMGSWEPVGEFGARYGRLGTTAITVLTLEVYYRDPAAYKGAGPKK